MGSTGAKRQSWKSANPREVLKRVIDANPRAQRDELKRLYSDEIRADEGLIDAAIEYSFDCNYRCLREPPPPPRKHEPVQASTAFGEAKEAVKQNVIAAVERKAKLKLLKLVLPNGKMLEDATGGDCYALAPQMGAWLTKIAGLVGPKQRVGSVLSEKEVRELFDR